MFDSSSPLCRKDKIIAQQAAETVQFDHQLFEEAFTLGYCAKARIWSNDNCLVVPSVWKNKPNFSNASQISAERGWPIILRRTGGSCVPHGRGVLNLSLIRSMAKNTFHSSTSEYQLIFDITNAALSKFGIVAKANSITSSICDGNWNICIDERKFGGTAQRCGTRGNTVTYLTHASLFLGNINHGLDASNAFLRDLQMPEFDPRTQLFLTVDKGISESEFIKTLRDILNVSSHINWEIM